MTDGNPLPLALTDGDLEAPVQIQLAARIRAWLDRESILLSFTGRYPVHDPYLLDATLMTPFDTLHCHVQLRTCPTTLPPIS